ncbi:hypothetical protein MASR1M8_15540 [Thermomonas brevis]
MTPADLVGIILAAAALLGVARLLIGLARLPAARRPRAWRSALLVLGTLASAALLWLLLRGDTQESQVRVLHVATAGAPRAGLPSTGDALRIALPEAGDGIDGSAMPDLATALRRHPAARALIIEGHGLERRDLPAAHGLQVAFQPPPLPPGLTSLWTPPRVQAGQALQVQAGATAPAGTIAELLDPAGKPADRQPLQDDGGIALRATPPAAGLATYTLRLRDAAGRDLDRVPVAVEVLAPASTKIALRAGGPDPELKFLRRWAADHGATLQASIALGMGMQAGDPPLPLDAASLDAIDLLVLDDRSWNGLSAGQRAAVLAAVRRGLGLLLRPAAALAGSGALGIGATAAPAVQTRPALAGIEPAQLPRLQLPPLRIANPQGVTVLRDERGQALAGWRAHGRGRVGIWLPQDSFQLALAGRGDLHARLWDAALQPLLRARLSRLPELPGDARAGQVTALCDVDDAAAVLAPDGTRTRLAVDPASGSRRCAAYWPQTGGWHRLMVGNAAHPFHVLAADAAPVLHLADLQRQTRALAGRATPITQADAAGATPRIGRWPLFALWLLLSVALWWLERSGLGRRASA